MYLLAQDLAFFALALAIFAPLERVFAARKQAILRPAFWTDFAYFVVGGLVASLLLATPLSLLAWGVHRLFPMGYFQQMAALPLPVRLIGAVVVGDFGYYWAHRWMHQIPAMWKFHAIHHSAEHMDWLVTTRAHPLDLVFGRLCSYVPLYALGLMQPSATKADIVPLLFVLIGKLWGFFIHANLNWRWGWAESLVATPAFHHWHHTNDGAELANKNYAAMVPAFDRLFGTFFLPARLPADYGIPDSMPKDLPGQLLYPVMPSRSPARAPMT